MGRLIDADKLKRHYAWWEIGDGEITYAEAKKQFDTIIDVQPAVDAVPLEDYKSMEQTVNKLTKALAGAEPVRHGHWEIKRNPMMYQTRPYVPVCSECGTAFPYKMPYCGECGAKMDEVEDE